MLFEFNDMKIYSKRGTESAIQTHVIETHSQEGSMMDIRKNAIFTLGFALCLGNRLMATEGDLPLKEPIPSPFWDARIFAMGNSDLKEGDAGYATSGVAMELGYRHWCLEIERQYFSWRNGETFPGATDGRDPWEFVNRIHLGFSHKHMHSERWMSEFLMGGRMGFEKNMGDSFSAYLGGYGVYRIHPRLILLLGIFYSRHPEIATDYDLMPILGLVWNPEETHGFSAQLGLPETQVRWHFDEQTRLVLDLNTLEGGVTRLANDSPVRERGYAELISATVSLRLERRFGDDVDLSVGIGHSVHRELKLYDSDGGNCRAVDIERGPSIEVSIRKPF